MRQISVLLVFFVLSASCRAQAKEANKNFIKGNQYYAEKEYEKAVEFYSLSIKQLPAPNAYLGRASVYLKLSDTCNYCKDIYMVYVHGEKKAEKIYKSICVTSDTIRSTEDSIKEEYPGYSYTIKETERCNTNSMIDYFDANNKFITSIYEKLPVFPGGEMAQIQFLGKNIEYPQFAKEYGIQGTVYVSFIIEKNGDVSNIRLIKGIGGGCNEESLRVVGLMPKWKPVTRKGIPIRAKMSMPIRYTLN
jgi:TonB family protein